MTARHRVLVAAFGSAGDLFPVVPLIQQMRADGHDVRCAVPRALGLYLRAAGLPHFALGDGREMQVLHDPGIVTTRFRGWASWHRVAAHYVAPTLPDHVRALGRIVGAWRPQVVVTTSFAAAARVAAHEHGLPRLDLSIYPQQVSQLPAARAFGRTLRTAVAAMCHRGEDSEVIGQLAWGSAKDVVVLHDRALLDATVRLPEVVGFPYWDRAPERPGDAAMVDAWLAASDAPTVLVTLGSFLGTQEHELWRTAARAATNLGVRALFVGPRGSVDMAELDRRSDVLLAGFLPLSSVVHRTAAVVHHGGIGTTFAVARAGRPAVVVPQAFDQGFNARLVQRSGVGLDASGIGLEAALARVLADGRVQAACRDLVDALAPSEVAAQRVVRRIVDRIEEET